VKNGEGAKAGEKHTWDEEGKAGGEGEKQVKKASAKKEPHPRRHWPRGAVRLEHPACLLDVPWPYIFLYFGKICQW
jgi:hypothetical protein